MILKQIKLVLQELLQAEIYHFLPVQLKQKSPDLMILSQKFLQKPMLLRVFIRQQIF